MPFPFASPLVYPAREEDPRQALALLGHGRAVSPAMSLSRGLSSFGGRRRSLLRILPLQKLQHQHLVLF